MPARDKRRIELLNLASSLRAYARSLQADSNAALMLVHQVLSAAFSERPDGRSPASLEASLRREVDRRSAI